jgi:hypothetical protein
MDEQVHVEIHRDASFKELRALLGRWMGADPEKVCVFFPTYRNGAHEPFFLALLVINDGDI